MAAKKLFVSLIISGVVATSATLPLAGQDQPEPPDRAGDRREGIPRQQVLEPDQGQGEGTEDGAPQLRDQPGNQRVAPQYLPPGIHPPGHQRWRLGIFAVNTDTGVVITRVVPQTPAARMGLERGDRIVTVGGFQVGWVNDRLYPLSYELDRQAGRQGTVTLLLQNVRNGQLLNQTVRLEPVGVRDFGRQSAAGAPRSRDDRP